MWYQAAVLNEEDKTCVCLWRFPPLRYSHDSFGIYDLNINVQANDGRLNVFKKQFWRA